MEPWIQPTTAPRQPDFTGDDDPVVARQPEVERGWMEAPAAPDVLPAPRSESMAADILTAAVAVGFILLATVAGPFLLLVVH